MGGPPIMSSCPKPDIGGRDSSRVIKQFEIIADLANSIIPSRGDDVGGVIRKGHCISLVLMGINLHICVSENCVKIMIALFLPLSTPSLSLTLLPAVFSHSDLCYRYRGIHHWLCQCVCVCVCVCVWGGGKIQNNFFRDCQLSNSSTRNLYSFQRCCSIKMTNLRCGYFAAITGEPGGKGTEP